MKKRDMKWVFAFVLLLSLVSGHTSFELADVYSPGRTMVLELPETITGGIERNMIQLLKEGHIETPWEYGLATSNEGNYLWGVAPLQEGNYSIALRDVIITRNGELVVEDVLFPFIVRGNVSLYSFTPGVINLNVSEPLLVISRANTPLTVNVKSEGESTVRLFPGKNTVNLTKLGIGFKEHFILGDYDVPVIGTQSHTPSGEVLPFEISPGSISFQGTVGSTPVWNVSLRALTQIKITLEYNESLFVVTPRSVSLDEGEEETVRISLKSPLRNSISSSLVLRGGNASYPLSIIALLRETPSNRTIDYASLYCAEVPGFVCAIEQRCDGDTYPVQGLTSTQLCCSVACTVPETPSSWVPWALFLSAVALAGGAYYYYRTKHAPDELDARVAKAEKKIHP
jgi:hypothetical protein